MTGCDWEWMLDCPELTEEELKPIWEQLRVELTEEHINERPGTRCWTFWRWEAPEQRRQVNDGPEPMGTELWYGKPRCYRGQPPEDMYESELCYLARLGLLTDHERLVECSLEELFATGKNDREIAGQLGMLVHDVEMWRKEIA